MANKRLKRSNSHIMISTELETAQMRLIMANKRLKRSNSHIVISTEFQSCNACNYFMMFLTQVLPKQCHSSKKM
jgi:uncharacterized protein YegP (UPF0339 family)